MGDPAFHQEALVQARIDIASLQTQVEAQGREIGELKQLVATLISTVNTMNATLSEARGGWKSLMLLGGAGATFGGLLTWALTHLSVRGTP